MASGQGSSLDRRLALSRVGGDEELLKEIAVLFMTDYPNSIREIRSAGERGDAKSVERYAHGLKGAVSNFGAETVVAAALRIEIMGRSQQLTELSSALAELEGALAELASDLNAL